MAKGTCVAEGPVSSVTFGSQFSILTDVIMRRRLTASHGTLQLYEALTNLLGVRDL